jgi:hypothetical protein
MSLNYQLSTFFVYQDPDLMAVFSFPEVMAALQDGMCLASHTNLVMLVTVHVQLPVFCVLVNSGAAEVILMLY